VAVEKGPRSGKSTQLLLPPRFRLAKKGSALPRAVTKTGRICALEYGRARGKLVGQINSIGQTGGILAEICERALRGMRDPCP